MLISRACACSPFIRCLPFYPRLSVVPSLLIVIIILIVFSPFRLSEDPLKRSVIAIIKKQTRDHPGKLVERFLDGHELGADRGDVGCGRGVRIAGRFGAETHFLLFAGAPGRAGRGGERINKAFRIRLCQVFSAYGIRHSWPCCRNPMWKLL